MTIQHQARALCYWSSCVLSAHCVGASLPCMASYRAGICGLCCIPHVNQSMLCVAPAGHHAGQGCRTFAASLKESKAFCACFARTLYTQGTILNQLPTHLGADHTLALQTSMRHCRHTTGPPRSSRGAFPSVGGSSCRMRPRCSWCRTRPRTFGEAAVLCAAVSKGAAARQVLPDVAPDLRPPGPPVRQLCCSRLQAVWPGSPGAVGRGSRACASQDFPKSQLYCTQPQPVLDGQHLRCPMWLQGQTPPRTAGKASRD